MSIVALKHIHLVGRQADRDAILTVLQRYGRLHIASNSGANPDQLPLSPRSRRVQEAIRFLAHSPVSRRPLKKFQGFHPDHIVDDVLALKEQLRNTEDQRDELQKRIQLMRPWGNFCFPADTMVEHFRLWFYRLPVNRYAALQQVDVPWQIVGRSSRFYYLVLISANEPAAHLLPVPREHLGSRSLGQLQDDLDATETRLEELYLQRQDLTRYLNLLQQFRARADSRSLWRYVRAQTEDHEPLFSLQGWLPATELASFDELARNTGFAWQARDPRPSEKPPTLLKPAPGFAAGGLLARFYQLPAYGSWDPSVQLFLSFVLFFAMILADAGYALLLMLPLLFGWKRLGRSETTRDLRQLLVWLSGGALVWGVLVGSYFGVAPPPDSWLAWPVVVDVGHYSQMMLLSVLVGIGHLTLAHLSLLRSQRFSWQLLVGRLGWILMMLMGVGFWQLDNHWQPLLFDGLGLSALMVLVGNWRSQGASWWRGGIKAVSALLDVSKLFGDVLSYMRLFALGLASASLALTFNQLAISRLHADSGIGVLEAGLILLLGHAINLGLGIMSGVVHGLRLNFIEFYNWGEPGEGYAFSPFRLEEIEHE